jgi:ubiquitin-like domain-containing CTD phosphatase 1
MFTVFSSRGGKEWTHSVKPLQLIWNKLPQYSSKNTIHIDDLGRNFALNPGEGLKIRAFKVRFYSTRLWLGVSVRLMALWQNCHTDEALADRELDKLGLYLCHIARNVPDFTTLKHKTWDRSPPPP